jgi:hypothetical protein
MQKMFLLPVGWCCSDDPSPVLPPSPLERFLHPASAAAYLRPSQLSLTANPDPAIGPVLLKKKN